MTNGYTTFDKAQPPIGLPIVCLFWSADMPESRMHHRANAMSKAIRRSDGEIYYHADTSPGMGRIRGRLMGWKRCWW
ncbi:hypothetical protein [Vreelandella gomseomensis]|uniref:Uncharacterized protein n=1 Tax=Vreelandella gomseomensis TaxID=370766 RepID=A0ABU1GDG6_9GAMM|nr:hypothetical protein [Halomonas gomseomensis]MDR5875123.1 hypothetical protein [Halomonas gomseomensis]